MSKDIPREEIELYDEDEDNPVSNVAHGDPIYRQLHLDFVYDLPPIEEEPPFDDLCEYDRIPDDAIIYDDEPPSIALCAKCGKKA